MLQKMHRKRKNKSPRESLECTTTQTHAFNCPLNKCKNMHKEICKQQQTHANQKQNKCIKNVLAFAFAVFFLHFMCVLFAIVFHVFCVSLGTRTKKSPKKERNITCKNIAHKTHKHRKQTRKKRWCEKFGCACAFLCVLFAFVLRLFIFYYYMFFFFLTVVLCFVCFFLRPFAHFVFFLYMQAF